MNKFFYGKKENKNITSPSNRLNHCVKKLNKKIEKYFISSFDDSIWCRCLITGILCDACIKEDREKEEDYSNNNLISDDFLLNNITTSISLFLQNFEKKYEQDIFNKKLQDYEQLQEYEQYYNVNMKYAQKRKRLRINPPSHKLH